ncbi:MULTISPECIES: hypothetical protein [Neobacillus]|uniref:Uncharacterized protein n=1 Tax=Neobacillus citreus TaxID=2833578 RepID=A0A942YC44_9BACI|nr:hypothetical protein [Neobacillus citreus]MCH6264559.1 hypothetical protein [Neobacillus citreus]
MSDEPQELPQEEPQEQPLERNQENIKTLKDEIKNEIREELKEKFIHSRKKRKHRIIYSVCVFALGVLIGFGGGRATHSEHHFDQVHKGHFEHGKFQKWHDMRK